MKRFLIPLIAFGLAIALFLVGSREYGGREDVVLVAAVGSQEEEPATLVLTETEAEPQPERDPVAASPLTVPAPESPESLDEETAQGISVFVTTPEGDPVAGILVALRGRFDMVRSNENTYASATTDAEGHAFLVEDEDDREKRRGFLEMFDMETLYRVEAQVLFAEPPAHDLGNNPEVTEPITLVLPASGRVLIHATTPDGKPLPERCQVVSSSRPVGSSEDYVYGPRGTRKIVVDGVATFPAMPLGHEFRFSLNGGSTYRGATDIALGPTRSGEVIELDMVFGAPLASITGLVVGEDGAPLTEVSVSMAVFLADLDAPPDFEPTRLSSRWVSLDAKGRFSHHTSLEPDDTQRIVIMVQEKSRRTQSEIDRFSRWDGVLELSPGETYDVGTLVLPPRPKRRFLVSGRVRSEDGGKLPNPGIGIRSWNSETRQSERLADDRIEVDRDGYFEAYTILEKIPETFTVSAGARGYLGASVTASLGDRGLELILSRGGGLAGRFVMDDKRALPLLAVRIEGEDFSRNPNIALGRFHVDSLPPGTYSVTAIGHSTKWRYGTVENVVVPKGGFANDPRLERIDLGNACRILSLIVLAPDGRPIPKHYISFKDTSGDGGKFRTDKKGEVFALVPTSADVLGLSVYFEGKKLGLLWSVSPDYTGTVTLTER